MENEETITIEKAIVTEQFKETPFWYSRKLENGKYEFYHKLTPEEVEALENQGQL